MQRIVFTSVNTRANLDELQLGTDRQAKLRGWIFREDTPINKIDIALQGRPWMSAVQLHDRPDVKAFFDTESNRLPHTIRSGFDITAPLPEGVEGQPGTVVEITPITQDGTKLEPFAYCWTHPHEIDQTPQPPVHLQHRIGESSNFVAAGAHLASLILTCVGKYRSVLECERILDWGCGCGRVIAQLTKVVPPGRLYGVDIDSEAIEWDKQNIPGPNFTRIEPYPPTPFSEGTFDLIYGISVMTHLDEETQFRWLDELRRISRPGAIIALTVIGQNLRAQRMPASIEQEFAQKGFLAFVPDYSDSLKDFSHEDYYKETYHSIEYIAANWGRYLEVLEYVETKHQDMVILRRT